MQCKSGLMIVAAVVLAHVWAAFGQVPASSPASDQLVAAAVKAPATLEEITRRRTAISKEIEQLRPATQSAATLTSQAATQPAGMATIRANEVWRLLADYDKVLAEQEAMHHRIDQLKSDEWLKKLSDEMNDLKERTKEVDRQLLSPPTYATEDELKQARELFEKRNQELEMTTKTLRARAQALRSYPQRRKEAAAEVSEARKSLDKALTDHTVQVGGGPKGPRKDLIVYDRRLAELQLEIAMSKAAGLALEETLNSLEQQQERRRSEAIQPYVKSLRLWADALAKAHAAGERGRIEWELSRATKPYEKRYWEAVKEIFRQYEFFRAYENPTRDLFPETQLGRLRKTINRRDNYWQIFLESLPRREGAVVLAKFKEIRAELDSQTRELEEHRQALYKSLDDRQAVLTRRDEVLEWFDEYRDKLAQSTSESNDEEAGKLEAQFAERRVTLIKQMDAIVALQDELIDRLKTAVQTQETYCDKLERYRSRLYWAYLVVRDQGLVRASWGQIRAEWRGGGAAISRSLRSTGQDFRDQLHRASGYRWGLAVLLLCCAVTFGLRAHRRLTAAADRLVATLSEQIDREGAEVADIGARMRLSALRLVGDTAVLTCVLVATLFSLSILGISGLPRRLAAAAILLVLGIRLAFGVTGRLFMVERPRFRVIRCSNKVAGYYRRWLSAVLFATTVMVPLPLVLELLDVMALTRTYIWQVYKSLCLVIALVFFLRKHLVLKVVGRPEEVRARGLYLLITWCYPLIPLGIAALLALEVLGYGALTSYVIVKTGLTILTAIGANTIFRYLGDSARRYQRHVEQRRLAEAAQSVPQQPPVPVEVKPGGGASGRAEADVENETGHFVGLLAWLVGWGVKIGALVIILRIWGITLVEIRDVLGFRLAGGGERILTLWRVLAAVLTIAAVLLVSRSLRSVLQARVYPEYPHLDLAARATINTLLHYALLVLGVYVALQLLYVDLGALTVLMGTLGLGLGLGLQPLFVNFISSLIIFFERHIRIGDIVEVGDKTGEVTRISMRSTSIRTPDNVLVVIPNSEFITSKAVNWSLPDRRIRGEINVGVAYGSDVNLVRQLLFQVAAEHPKVVREPAPAVWFTDFGDNALTFRLLVWFGDISHRMDAMTDLRFSINRLFAEHGIEIPFPQRTISLQGDKPLPVEVVEKK
jgi:small-conductance mechanosensitive channel